MCLYTSGGGRVLQTHFLVAEQATEESKLVLNVYSEVPDQ
tara:strand:+ start:174 stop:293 length:120 start_codon:yes stop_codon:yes gene_type:complete